PFTALSRSAADSLSLHDALPICFRRVVQAALDAVVTRDAVALGDVERAPAEHDPVRRIEPLEQGLHLALAAAVDDSIDVLQLASAHEHRAFAAERHGARSGEAVNPY